MDLPRSFLEIAESLIYAQNHYLAEKQSLELLKMCTLET